MTAPLLVIVGETASGKTALAIELAKKLNGEIICADSWTVYKGFDTGTAKPTLNEQQGIPHYLLDVAEPQDGFSVVMFQRLAKRLINDISRRGKLPIIVGGTGLYVDSVLFNYSFLPPSDPSLRKELNVLTIDELAAKTRALKLDTANIDMRNKRRIIRLIENNGQMPSKSELRQNTVVLGVARAREELQYRIEKRVDDMVKCGLANEVDDLSKKYGWDCEPMKAPAYRAFREYCEGSISLEEAKYRMVRNDLKLAKKQRTWFKRHDFIRWFRPGYKIEDIITLIDDELHK